MPKTKIAESTATRTGIIAAVLMIVGIFGALAYFAKSLPAFSSYRVLQRSQWMGQLDAPDFGNEAIPGDRGRCLEGCDAEQKICAQQVGKNFNPLTCLEIAECAPQCRDWWRRLIPGFNYERCLRTSCPKETVNACDARTLHEIDRCLEKLNSCNVQCKGTYPDAVVSSPAPFVPSTGGRTPYQNVAPPDQQFQRAPAGPSAPQTPSIPQSPGWPGGGEFFIE